MVDWVKPVLIAAAVMAGLWALLVVLPPGCRPGCSRTWPGSCLPA
jgi:hypothetical protein